MLTKSRKREREAQNLERKKEENETKKNKRGNEEKKIKKRYKLNRFGTWVPRFCWECTLEIICYYHFLKINKRSGHL